MDRAELRRLAEAAIAAQDNIVGPYNDETAVAWGKALQAYTKAANPAAIIKLLDEIAVANARIAELESNKCETCFDNYAKAIGKLTERAERAEAECKRLRVCGNCRHYSRGYDGSFCADDASFDEKELGRQMTCNDWEMV